MKKLWSVLQVFFIGLFNGNKWTAKRVAKIVITSAEMRRWYKKEFGVSVDFGKPKSSDPVYTWAVCDPPRNILSNKDIVSGGHNSLPISSFFYEEGEFDDNILHEGRDINDEIRVVFIRPNLFADEDMRFLPYDDIVERSIRVLTLREVLIIYRFMWNRYGIRLDSGLGTLTGSRFPDGKVPFFGWRNNSYVVVGGADSNNHLGFWCARRAVPAVFTQ